MNGSGALKFIVGLAIVVVIGMIVYIFFGSLHRNITSTVNTTSQTIPVKDFAPSLPNSQKTTLLIQSSDSSEEKYIVPKDQVTTYEKSLPEGYHVISKTP